MQKEKLDRCCVRSFTWGGGGVSYDFTSFFVVFQSYQDNWGGGAIMKGCEQGNKGTPFTVERHPSLENLKCFAQFMYCICGQNTGL